MFPGLFFYLLGDEGAAGSQVSMNTMDQTSQKINTVTRFVILLTVIHSITRVQEHTLTH